MTIHFTLSWWALAVLWFVASLVFVVIRNAIMDDGNDCGLGAMVFDIPELAVGFFGAIGIIVGHFM